MTHNTTASWNVTNFTLVHRRTNVWWQFAVCTVSHTEDEGSRTLGKPVTHPQHCQIPWESN